MQQGMQSGNQNYGNQQYGNQQYGGQQYGNQQYGGQQYGNQQYGGQQYGNQQYGGQQYGNQQYGGQQYGNQQYGGQQYGNQQYGNQHYGNNQGMQENGWLGFCCATCLTLGHIAGYMPLVIIEHPPPFNTVSPLTWPSCLEDDNNAWQPQMMVFFVFPGILRFGVYP